jgi:Dolichyl-phosphate-mannose-protein mannosyltransferase
MANDNPEILTPWLGHRTAKWLTPVLLIFGLQCWLVLGGGDYGRQYKPLMILAAVVAGLIEPISRAFDRLWNAAARPTPKRRRWIALAIGVSSSLFLYWAARWQHIILKPQFEDEFSYLIQMRMLAHGRFWMPAIPLPEFFDSFYVLVKPVYASMYFPGTAIMYVPALLLNMPYIVAPLAASGLCAAMLYLILTDVLDGASAILGVLLLLSLSMFRLMSIMLMAQIPMLLLGLVMTWAALQWRRNNSKRWLLLLGAAAGWAAITRPADALCFAIVLGSVMATDMRGKSWPDWVKTAACIIAPALPFLILQLILNRQITGQWLTTPFGRYNDINYPGAFGFHGGSAPLHVSDIPEKQLFYEKNVKWLLDQHQLKNLITVGLKDESGMVARFAIVDPFFWIIAPISLLAMWNRRLWMVWGMLPVFLLIMSAYAFSWDLSHYYVMVMPATILLSVLPIRFLTDTFPKRAAMIRTMLGLSMIALSLAAMPQFNRLVHDRYFNYAELDRIDNDLAANVVAPAVVMFHFNPATNNPSEEPVFNPDVAWPDDAAIIRVRDLNTDISAIGHPGDRDRPLYEYYSRVAPTRVFYLYDRSGGTEKLKRLGTADVLDRK